MDGKRVMPRAAGAAARHDAVRATLGSWDAARTSVRQPSDRRNSPRSSNGEDTSTHIWLFCLTSGEMNRLRAAPICADNALSFLPRRMSASLPLPPARPAAAPSCLLLLAHGSRRAQWAAPFEKVLETLRRLQPHVDARLCFLEAMHPTLAEALDAAGGERRALVRVVPLFLGTGTHLADDVAREVERMRAKHPRMRVDVAPAAGDSALVAQALATYALQCLHDVPCTDGGKD